MILESDVIVISPGLHSGVFVGRKCTIHTRGDCPNAVITLKPETYVFGRGLSERTKSQAIKHARDGVRFYGLVELTPQEAMEF